MINRKNSTKEFFKVPSECPVCGHQTEEDGKFLICPNDNCPALEYGNLYKWINTLEIKGVGDATIEMLQEKRLVTEPAHFYNLTKEQLLKLDRMGDRSAEKILKALHAKKEIELHVFIGGLNIKDVSKSTAKAMIEAGYDSIDKMHTAAIGDLIKISGIEYVTAEKIVLGLVEKADVIDNLLEVGITIKKPIVVTDGKLKDLSFCVTGKLNTMKRNELEDLVKMNGGMLKSVSKKLSYLVTNDPDSGSGKNLKAQQEGVATISEDEFLEMIK